MGGPKLDTVCRCHLKRTKKRGMTLFLAVLVLLMFLQPKMLLANYAAMAHSSPTSHLLPTRTPRTLSTELLTSQSMPSLPYWQRLFLPGAALCICLC